MASFGELYDEAVGSVDLQNFCELFNKYPTTMNLFMPFAKPSQVKCSCIFYSVCKRCGSFKATHFSNILCSAMRFEVLIVVFIKIMVLVGMKFGISISKFSMNMFSPSSSSMLMHHLPNYTLSHLRRPQVSCTLCSDCLFLGSFCYLVLRKKNFHCLDPSVSSNEKLEML